VHSYYGHNVPSSFETIQRLLEDTQVSYASPIFIEIWGASIFLAVLVSAPVLFFYGVSLSNYDFYIIFVATTVLCEIFAAFITHALLRLSRQSSIFNETLKIYTIRFIYFPVISIFQMPTTVASYQRMHSIKANEAGLGLIEGIAKLFQPVSPTKPTNDFESLG